ncbi:hypothetical protein GCM10010965_14510 [Caldalkalibacillus thermarum]|uniref:putative toxin-antitoxin system toxin component, PIN family n=1 Tax=Caldalkalibacillus thermarum TaxID=296745 RepID=UPI001667FE85|nr:putative toxin-antitoxin system toxin component, PIN family [Caldalkalibacillus thermarum]GGK22700.1 hypothetical protein GCM10010965_14510 [Caldalkalibacillus thermarum]
MTKVVLDTSVFIGGFLERNESCIATILLVLTKFQPVYTDEMAKELLVTIHLVVGRKGRNPLPAFRKAAQLLLSAERVARKTPFSWCYDPTDAMFIECAIDGGAKVVVSNDRSLTTLKEYVTDQEALEMIDGIAFLTPRDFLKEYGR